VEIVLLLIVIFVALVIYFLPAITAKEKKNSSLIFWLNLFFGVTGIVWIILLIWAAVDENK